MAKVGESMSRDYYQKYIQKMNEQQKSETMSQSVKKAVDQNSVGVGPKSFLAQINKEVLPNDSKIELAKDEKPLTEYDLVILGGQVVFPEFGVLKTNIGIKDGKIAKISEKLIAGKRIVHAEGKYVSPGIIDPHVHLGLFNPFEVEIETETRAAIAGGVTTLGCFIASNSTHQQTFPQLASYIQEKSFVDIIPHCVIHGDDQKNEIKALIENYGITSFKLYMNGIPGIIEDVGDGYMLDVFEEIKNAGKPALICVHTENRELVRRGTKQVQTDKKEGASIKDWTDTHPDMAEEEASIRLSYFAKKMGVHVYLVHLSSKGAAKTLAKIKKDNGFVHVETTSPYLSIHNESTSSFIIKMEPPFRKKEDLDALWEAIKNDTIDTIGTDNVTMTINEKNAHASSLWEVMPGYPAVETHLPVMLHEGVIARKIPIENIITKMTKNPAELFGVYPQKGAIKVGSDADIVIIDLNMKQTVNASNLKSRSDFSLYDGWELQGWPIMTIKGGCIAYEHGKEEVVRSQSQYIKR